ncbi:unnamed protein product [Urochloa humidicola]
MAPSMPVDMPAATLGLGKPMPRLGFGMASATLGQAEGHAGVAQAVLHALDAGYRHFDTASSYNTEAAVGDAVAQAVRAGKIRPVTISTLPRSSGSPTRTPDVFCRRFRSHSGICGWTTLI